MNTNFNFMLSSQKTQVLYIEACESGSIFEGLLSNNLGIYATTASNANENSYATYCPGDSSAELDTCLGDLYSISWMEDWYVFHSSYLQANQNVSSIFSCN